MKCMKCVGALTAVVMMVGRGGDGKEYALESDIRSWYSALNEGVDGAEVV